MGRWRSFASAEFSWRTNPETYFGPIRKFDFSERRSGFQRHATGNFIDTPIAVGDDGRCMRARSSAVYRAGYAGPDEMDVRPRDSDGISQIPGDCRGRTIIAVSIKTWCSVLAGRVGEMEIPFAEDAKHDPPGCPGAGQRWNDLCTCGNEAGCAVRSGQAALGLPLQGTPVGRRHWRLTERCTLRCRKARFTRYRPGAAVAAKRWPNISMMRQIPADLPARVLNEHFAWERDAIE